MVEKRRSAAGMLVAVSADLLWIIVMVDVQMNVSQSNRPDLVNTPPTFWACLPRRIQDLGITTSTLIQPQQSVNDDAQVVTGWTRLPRRA